MLGFRRFVWALPLVFAAQPNDDCNNATVITAGTTAVNSTGSTTSTSCPSCCTPSDVWFSYTTTCTGTLEIRASAGPNADVNLCLFSNQNCSGLVTKKCLNRTGVGGEEYFLFWGVTVNTSFLFSWGSFPSVSNGSLTLKCRPAALNDNCANSKALNTGFKSFGSNWAATDTNYVFGPTTCTGVKCAADLWFAHTASCTGQTTFLFTSQSTNFVVLSMGAVNCGGSPPLATCYTPPSPSTKYVNFTFFTNQNSVYRLSVCKNTVCDWNSNLGNTCDKNVDYASTSCLIEDLNITASCNGVQTPTPPTTASPSTSIPPTNPTTSEPTASPTRVNTSGASPSPSPPPPDLTGPIVGGVLGGVFFFGGAFGVWFYLRRRRRMRKRKIGKSKGIGDDDDPETDQINTVPFSTLSVGEKLGTGAFGSVHQCVWSGADYAVKRMNKESKEAEDEFDKEIRINKHLASHPHTCVVRAICLTSSPRGIVMELFPLRSLEHFLIRDGQLSKKTDFVSVLTILVNASAGILHLHNQRVIHRDIASRNFLVKVDLSTAACDFGLSIIVPNDNKVFQSTVEERQHDILPINSSAPETLIRGEYSYASDVYMFGIFLWEVFARRAPLMERPEFRTSPIDVLGLITALEKGLRPDIPSHWPPALRALIEKCWSAKPEDRPNMEKVNQELRAMRQEAERLHTPLPTVESSLPLSGAEEGMYANAYGYANVYGVTN